MARARWTASESGRGIRGRSSCNAVGVWVVCCNKIAASVGPQHRNRLGTDAAKLFASTAAKEIADAAVQVLGGYGYCTEFRVEQFLRDSKLIEIGGGTLEAHQKNITRDLTQR